MNSGKRELALFEVNLTYIGSKPSLFRACRGVCIASVPAIRWLCKFSLAIFNVNVAYTVVSVLRLIYSNILNFFISLFHFVAVELVLPEKVLLFFRVMIFIEMAGDPYKIVIWVFQFAGVISVDCDFHIRTKNINSKSKWSRIKHTLV